MRTTADLKLAVAILVQNISTTNSHHRVVSSTLVFIAWRKSPTGEFASFLRQSLKRPSAKARFDVIRSESGKIDLLDASADLRDKLDTLSVENGSVKELVKQAKFRGVVLHSTTEQARQNLEWRSQRSAPHNRGRVARVPRVSTVVHPRPRAGGEKPVKFPAEKMTRVFRDDSASSSLGHKSRVKPSERIAYKPIAKRPLQIKQSFITHRLHFGTDRLLNLDGNGAPTFGDVRGDDKVTYGVANVSIPVVHKEGALERPLRSLLKWTRPEEDPNKHIVIHTLTPLELSDWCRSAKLEEGEGLLFIHGYNVSFNEAIWRAAQICHDLKFVGTMLCYSWSSSGKVLDYAADESTIDWSQEHLRTFLTEVTTKLGLSRLHIVAHSMGNRALLAVLETWQNEPGYTPIDQVVLAAPDIDAGRFKQISKVFKKYKQVTLYASQTDKAICVSTKIHRHKRAGNAKPPIVLEGLSTVDVSTAGADMFGLGHSYFATSKTVFRDLYYIIKQRFTPDLRAGITLDELGYYKLS
ncbi:alpha/beta hydrolase [Pseudomonas viridiflava]|uniref:alpha/beta hydrolase n=1 Tax=Pseudomonas viridiflava TaxID=33069 RepID=UPI002EB403D2|nr:alpha/beta hydrolase [Pseudomonas viridiflava]